MIFFHSPLPQPLNPLFQKTSISFNTDDNMKLPMITIPPQWYIYIDKCVIFWSKFTLCQVDFTNTTYLPQSTLHIQPPVNIKSIVIYAYLIPRARCGEENDDVFSATFNHITTSPIMCCVQPQTPMRWVRFQYPMMPMGRNLLCSVKKRDMFLMLVSWHICTSTPRLAATTPMTPPTTP